MNSLNRLAWLLLVVSTAEALRTCLDVQQTMMACLLSSNVNMTHPYQQKDVTQMCWEMKVMTGCVDSAQSMCPDLPIFNEHSFVISIGDMRRQMGKYCNRPEELMANDQPPRETCEPEFVTSRCSGIKITQGDQEEMCRSWEDFLACLEQVQEECKEEFKNYAFDISETIKYTRTAIETECPNENCDKVREDAERDCSNYLNNGDGEAYCRYLEMFMDCLHRKLTDCPNPELLTNVANQFRHHCPSAATRTCPDDPEAAFVVCTEILHGRFDAERESYCRVTTQYLDCADDLLDRCKDDPRLEASIVGIDLQRESVDKHC